MNPQHATCTKHVQCDNIISNSKLAMDTATDEIEEATIDSNQLSEMPIQSKAGRL